MTAMRTIRIAAWAAILMLAGVLAWTFAVNRGGDGPPAGLAIAAIGGPFTLTDQHGNTVTEAALKGHASALFFGYTFCPDVCPMTLSDMTAWLMDLGAEGDKLKVYFITVDPERDTEQQMAEYLQAFDPRIIGLTGSRPAIDQIIKEYRVYARKVPGEDGAYSMDHTAAVYLLDSEANFVGTVDYQEDHDTALAKLKRLIERS
jgi:protein SCO1/2